MSKSNKLPFVLLLTFILLLTACSSTPEDFSYLFETEPENIEPYSTGKPVSTPVEITTLSENPIDIETINEPNGSMQKISGLKNKAIEDEINNIIYNMFQKMKRYAFLEEVPPYPGYAIKFDDANKSMDRYYSVEIVFNSNNILSISANVDFYYITKGMHQSFNHFEAVTLDLNTGKPIALSQLFLDNSDWKTVVNDEINTCLASNRADEEKLEFNYYSYPSDILLVKPFMGIEDTFNYRIRQNHIELIFDYNDSVFYTADGSVIIPLQMNNFLDLLAFSERFVTDDSLYDNPINMISFFSPEFYPATPVDQHETVDGRDWYTSTYNSSVDEIIKTRSDELSEEVREKIKIVLEDNPEYTSIYENKSWAQIGPFTNLRIDINLVANNNYYWASYSYVFDDLGKILTLADLFVDSFNYEALLKDEVIQATQAQQIILTDDQIQLLSDTLMFQINSTSLYFTTLPINRDQRESSPISLFFQFDEIGIENLKIFD